VTVAIGLSAAVDRARWGPWEEPVAMLTTAYARAVQRAGAIALLLPPDEVLEESPDPLLDRIEGLILSGGSDVDPASYGAERHPETTGTWPERDRFEIALARRALDRDMPVLGICRGMQILNVACGGTLVQHLPNTLGHENHRPTPGVFGDHEVRLEPGSLAARAAGAERIAVKSHHHQGIDRLGEGIVASGWSQDDEVIEAFELPDRRFALAALWHPEEDRDSPLVGALVDAARVEVAR
jgi:putative glutamine amidotransferase